jgi:hypothetical protein
MLIKIVALLTNYMVVVAPKNEATLQCALIWGENMIGALIGIMEALLPPV